MGFHGTRLATVDSGGIIVVNGNPVGTSAQIKVGDLVAIRATAASVPETTLTFTLKIGSIQRPWSLTSRLKTAHVLTTAPSSISNMWVDGESGEAYSPVTNVTVRNNSGEDSAVMGVVSFSPAGNFEVTASTCVGLTLAPGQNCVVSVRAKATATAILSSTMTVASMGVSNPGAVNGTVSLSGDALFPVTLSNSTNVNVSSLAVFMTNGRWAQNRPKRVIIPSGVTIGSASPATAAMRSGTGWGGTLYITNNGSIQGAGGQPNGGQGGTAFLADAAGIQLINNGTIYGGGGGGGKGGTGGQGTYNTNQTVTEGPFYCKSSACSPFYIWLGRDGSLNNMMWAGTHIPSVDYNFNTTGSTFSWVGYTYTRGALKVSGTGGSKDDGYYTVQEYALSRSYNTTVPVYTAGGAGGNGGRGQGYDGANAVGVAGVAGGTNAGTGGTGGAGGTWGAAGGAGGTGVAGNNGSGAGGGAGGAAGYAIQNWGNVTLTGAGTRLGL